MMDLRRWPSITAKKDGRLTNGEKRETLCPRVTLVIRVKKESRLDRDVFV